MMILGQKDGKMLLGMLTMSRDESKHYRKDYGNGFLLEVDKVPKKIQDKLAIGGYGCQVEEYFYSNTAGATAGKWFKNIADRIKFKLRNDNILEELNRETEFTKGIELIATALERDRDSLKFWFSSNTYNYFPEGHREKNRIECILELKIYKDDFVSCPHLFENDSNYEQYKKFFLGRDIAIIKFDFEFPVEYKSANHEGLAKLEKLFRRKNEYTISDIEKLLEGSVNHKWYFSTDENTTFYGNDGFYDKLRNSNK